MKLKLKMSRSWSRAKVTAPASVKYLGFGSETLVLADQEPLFTGGSNVPSGFDFAEILGCKV